MKKTLLFAAALTGTMAVNAQTLPRAVWSCDFEGVEQASDIKGAEQVGSGEFRVADDKNFGTYYLNKPVNDTHTKSENYLILPTTGFFDCASKSAGGFTISLWVNAYYHQADKVNPWFSSIFNCFSRDNSYKSFGWPMMDVRRRGNLQINCDGWCDYTNEENVNGVIKEDPSWLDVKKVAVDTVPDSQGEDSIIYDITPFEENWHMVTIVFSGFNAKYYVDTEIWNEWNATNNSYIFTEHMSLLNDIYLGQSQMWGWNDPDCTYAYDDIRMYPDALTAEQIELLINIKKGNIDEKTAKIIAQANMETEIEELQDYCELITVLDLVTIGEEMMAKAGAIAEDAEDTADGYNAAARAIKAIKNDYVDIVDGTYNLLDACHSENAYMMEITHYPGEAAFKTALGQVVEYIKDATKLETLAEANKMLAEARKAYVFSQTGKEINVSKMIKNPWFCDWRVEPDYFVEGDSIHYPDGYRPGDYLTKEGWTLFTTLTGDKDIQIFYTQGMTTSNLYHSSDKVGEILDVYQDVENLKAGYYRASALMSSTSDATNNHVYATSGDFTKVSPVFDGRHWSDPVKISDWQKLTTDVIYVGEDGKMRIGATSTTDGNRWKGWFCATNFQLTYLGTEYDFSADVQAKKAEVENAIETLALAGDKVAMTAELDDVLKSDATDYSKVSMLTDLVSKTATVAGAEKAVVAVSESVDKLANIFTEGTANTLVKLAKANIDQIIAADTTSVAALPALKDLSIAYTSAADLAAGVDEWNSEAISAAMQMAIAAITPATSAMELTVVTEAIRAAMVESIPSFPATEADPKDVTAILKNADFKINGVDAGWDIKGGHAVDQHEIEFYNTEFSLTQTIKNLPAGMYRLEMAGFYRTGNDYKKCAADMIPTDSTDAPYWEKANVKLYAAATDGSWAYEEPVVSIASDSVTCAAGSEISYEDYYGTTLKVQGDFICNDETADPLAYYPNWMSNAYYCIQIKGLYAGNALDFFFTEDQDYTIGVVKEKKIDNDWAIATNFKLYYTGPVTPESIEANESEAEGEGAVAYKTIGGVPVVKPTTTGLYIATYANGVSKTIYVK